VPQGRRRRRATRTERIVLLAIAITLALVGGAVYGLVATGSGPGRPLAAGSGNDFAGGAPTTTTSTTTTTTTTPTTTTLANPAPGAGTPVAPVPLVAGSGGAVGGAGSYPPSAIVDPTPVATAVVSSLPLYAAPGAPTPVSHLANPNWLGAPLTLLVTGYQGDWVQAYIPVRPNETTAWFPLADVTITPDPYHIVVTISAHQLVLYKNNAPVFTAPVATGAPDSPTPTGSYFVSFIVKLTDPQDAYGPYAFGTSAFSNTYFSFEGGPGQVGIHGTNQPWVIGSYASHGCIRLHNNDITTVATQIMPGTPVEIAP